MPPCYGLRMSQRRGEYADGGRHMAGLMKLDMKCAHVAVFLALSVTLAGCSGGTSGLTTGTLLPTPAVKPPADPTVERAIQVGATTARASKCGYNFDSQKLKANYLAYEASQPGADTAKAEKAFETTRSAVAAKIPDSSEYCTDEQTATIKGDLTRHLAGDFNPPPKKAEATLADILASKDEKAYDPKEAFCRNGSCY